ncbi:MAG: AAA family ATPase [Coriobacteriia bacterium]|nr:AAA family ATPase [Coriobacteriia bacterium]
MQIAKVHIENFRSIAECDIEFTSLTAIIGANNTGKSNILLALKRVLAGDWVNASTFSESDVRGHDPDRDIVIEVTLDPPLQYRRYKEASAVSIGCLRFAFTRYKKGDKAGQRRIEQMCLSPAGKQVAVPTSAPKKGQQLKFEPLLGIPPEVRQAIPVVYVGVDRSVRNQLPGARNSLLRLLLQDIVESFEGEACIAESEDATAAEGASRSERFSEAMTVVMGLLRTDEFNDLEATIKAKSLEQLGFDPTVDEDMLDLYFAPLEPMDFYKNLDLRVREGECAVSATELGGGVQNAIVMAILQAFEQRRKKGAVLLIEEPEMFLHPQMQRSLYKTLRDISSRNQVICTTHSPHFIRVEEYQEVRLVTKTEDGTAVAASSLERTTARVEKLRKELDPERAEMFFASRVLFVEGDTEKLALPEYAKRLNIDLDRAGATVVEVGGKRNLQEMALIAKSFGIPVGILFDSDTKNSDDECLNRELLGLGDASTQTWACEPDYEAEVKAAMGDSEYEAACSRHPGLRKPVKARLIAAEPESAIPAKVEQALRWLGRSD